jgi:signal transduction histidine kinase
MNPSCKLIITILLFACKGVCAQSFLPAVYELGTDTAALYKLEGNYSQMLEDPEDKYTIEQVASSAFNSKFGINNTAKTGVKAKIRTYWFRFRLRNQLNRDVQLYFNSNRAYTYMELYTPIGNDKWQKQSTGVLMPWSQRDGLKQELKLPYILKQGQEVLVYQKVKYDFRYRAPELPAPSFTIKERFLESFYYTTADGNGMRKLITDGIVMGIWLIAALYNLVLFFIVREKVYLYFSLWVFLYCCIAFQDQLQLLLYREQIALFSSLIQSPFNWVTAMFQVLFIRSFLQTRKNLPQWDKALLFTLSWFAIGWTIGDVFFLDSPIHIRRIVGPLIDLGYSATCLLIGLITILMVKKGDRSAIFLMIATIPTMLLIGVGNIPHAIYFLITDEYLFSLESEKKLISISFLWMVIIFFGALIRRYNQTRQDLAQQALERAAERSRLIEAQKEELERQVTARTADLKQSIEELKSTQAQLIQSEKMASLGQLTAGIAHEIQNPLNFVNNFSEINTELIDELKTELKADNKEEALLIADDIKENEQKIIHHGRRADSIVKGMLQHSRTNTGKKELTDINALVDESLRLSYHGLRAKDKEFNATINTNFDESIGKLSIVPQDISRVLLNLFNNAFYAVHEKKNKLNGTFEPSVSVCTKKLDGK